MNKRTVEILTAIIDEYVYSAEPIGSKNLLLKYDFGVSSATIRNEMSQLEHEGYITQPYTSAGRIPSEKGYRFYVDNLFKEISQKRYMMELIERIEALSQIDKIIEDISTLISKKTNYTAIGVRNRDVSRILSVHILEMKENEYVTVIIFDDRKVEHRAIKVKKECVLNIEVISNYLNKKIEGKTSAEIINQDYEEILLFSSDNKRFCTLVLKEIFEVLKQSDDYDMYIKGKEKLLNFPEFSNPNDARIVMEALNKKQQLIDLFGHTENEKIDISIGTENHNKGLKDLSIVKKSVDMGEFGFITIALAGPIRMDYKKVITSFSELGNLIDGLIKKY